MDAMAINQSTFLCQPKFIATISVKSYMFYTEVATMQYNADCSTAYYRFKKKITAFMLNAEF
jgi:hypothetical protein